MPEKEKRRERAKKMECRRKVCGRKPVEILQSWGHSSTMLTCPPLTPSVKSPTLPNACMMSHVFMRVCVCVVCISQGRIEFYIWNDVV